MNDESEATGGGPAIHSLIDQEAILKDTLLRRGIGGSQLLHPSPRKGVVWREVRSLSKAAGDSVSDGGTGSQAAARAIQLPYDADRAIDAAEGLAGSVANTLKSAERAGRTVSTAARDGVRTGANIVRAGQGAVRIWGGEGAKAAAGYFGRGLGQMAGRAAAGAGHWAGRAARHTARAAAQAVTGVFKHVLAHAGALAIAAAVICVAGSSLLNDIMTIVAGAYDGLVSFFDVTDSSGELQNLDIAAYLTVQVPLKRQEIIDSLLEKRAGAQAQGETAELYIDGQPADFSAAGIDGAIYGAEQLERLVQPVLQTAMLSEYDFEPTQAQLDTSFGEIFSAIVTVEEQTVSSESGAVFRVRVSQNGLETLMDKYFVQPIARLESLPSLTDEQKLRLEQLRESYEICLSVAENSEEGGGDDPAD